MLININMDQLSGSSGFRASRKISAFSGGFRLIGSVKRIRAQTEPLPAGVSISGIKCLRVGCECMRGLEHRADKRLSFHFGIEPLNHKGRPMERGAHGGERGS